MTSDDVVVTAILLAICVVVIAVIGAICRMIGNYNLKATSTSIARCRSGLASQENVSLLSQRSQERKGPSDVDHPKTTIDRSTFGSRPQRELQERAGTNGLEEGRSGQRDKGSIEFLRNCRGEIKEDQARVRRRSCNGGSAGHDVIEAEEVAQAPPIAPPTSAPHQVSPSDDDTVLQDIVVAEGVTSSSQGMQGVTGLTSGLQRALSCDSVMSDMSLADMDVMPSEVNKIGHLEFGLHYDSELNDLVVSVIQAKDLERNPVTGSQDSYVKLWLTPHHDDRKYQTKTQKDSVNPEYSERFRFHVIPEQLDESCVQFQVYSCDRYARQKLLGETEVRLGDVDLRHSVRVWMNLHEMDQRPANFGGIMFSMAYLPTAERLTVVIAKARNLQCPAAKLSTDCFAKVHLLLKEMKVAKKKTSKKRDARNPIFNEAMTFAVPASSLLSVQLRVSVFVTLTARGGGVEDEEAPEVYPVGHVTVGPKSDGMELVHWTQTMTSLRKPVTMWHSLCRD